MAKPRLAPLLRMMLRAGPLTVTELHEKLGYSSPASITRALQHMSDTYIVSWQACEGPSRYAAVWAKVRVPMDMPHPDAGGLL